MSKNGVPDVWNKIKFNPKKTFNIVLASLLVSGGAILFGPTVSSAVRNVSKALDSSGAFDPDLGVNLLPSQVPDALAIVHQGFLNVDSAEYKNYLENLNQLRVKQKERGGIVIEVMTQSDFESTENPTADGQTLYFITPPANAGVTSLAVEYENENYYQGTITPHQKMLADAGVTSIMVVGEGTNDCRHQFEGMMSNNFDIVPYPDSMVYP